MNTTYTIQVFDRASRNFKLVTSRPRLQAAIAIYNETIRRVDARKVGGVRIIDQDEQVIEYCDVFS